MINIFISKDTVLAFIHGGQPPFFSILISQFSTTSNAKHPRPPPPCPFKTSAGREARPGGGRQGSSPGAAPPRAAGAGRSLPRPRKEEEGGPGPRRAAWAAGCHRRRRGWAGTSRSAIRSFNTRCVGCVFGAGGFMFWGRDGEVSTSRCNSFRCKLMCHLTITCTSEKCGAAGENGEECGHQE